MGSENMSSSLTTKRKKVSSGSYTVKTTGSAGAFHTGFRPLSPAVRRMTARSHDYKDSTGEICHPTKPLIVWFSQLAPLTVDNGLELLLCMSTYLYLNEWTGNAAAGLRKMSSSNHLQNTKPAAVIKFYSDQQAKHQYTDIHPVLFILLQNKLNELNVSFLNICLF